MDDKIRALERARNWEGLKRAYKRWITWPQQFRVHAKAKHAPLLP
ncbi:hypothetical protein LCGC14_0814690 [marine sediment metagenome]|uniref:Uncharacterized protein n=1 Tax=marine sediment metagenome TaxID=412755 RepID=A0A0F9ST71_9ZZZZ